MDTQNDIQIKGLLDLKQREARAIGAAERQANQCRPERPPEIRITGETGWWRRLWHGRAHLPHRR